MSLQPFSHLYGHHTTAATRQNWNCLSNFRGKNMSSSRGQTQRENINRAVTERECCSIAVAAASIEISPGFKTFIHVVLPGRHMAGMGVSFLCRMPRPLLALSQVLPQASSPFHRMFPHHLAAVCREAKNTDHTQEDRSPIRSLLPSSESVRPPCPQSHPILHLVLRRTMKIMESRSGGCIVLSWVGLSLCIYNFDFACPPLCFLALRQMQVQYLFFGVGGYSRCPPSLACALVKASMLHYLRRPSGPFS